MQRISGYIASLLLAAALVSSMAISGCSAQVSGQVKKAQVNTDVPTPQPNGVQQPARAQVSR